MAPPLSLRLRDVRSAREDPHRLQEMIQQLKEAIAQDETDDEGHRIIGYKDLLETAEEFSFKFLKEPPATTATDASVRSGVADVAKDNISPLYQEKLRKEFLHVKNNPRKLQTFVENVNSMLDTLPFGPKWDFFFRLLGQAKTTYTSLTQKKEMVKLLKEPPAKDSSTRKVQPDEDETGNAKIGKAAEISEDQHAVARKRSPPTSGAKSYGRKRRRG